LYKFDVAISYAVEQTSYVEKFAKCLNEISIRVFYAPDMQNHLWGTNLVEELQKVYMSQSRFCVVFLSKEYAEKAFTRHEFDSIINHYLIERLNSNDHFLLPIRFDSTKIPGLNPSLVYLNAADYSPSQLADFVHSKLNNLSTIEPSTISISELYKTIIHSIDNEKFNNDNHEIIIEKEITDSLCNYTFYEKSKIMYFFSMDYDSRTQTIKILDSRYKPQNIANSYTALIFKENNSNIIQNLMFLPHLGFVEVPVTETLIIDIIRKKLLWENY
jgi:hypothetical protein